MRLERREGYRVIIGAPVPPQADAITLGKTILVRAAHAGSSSLMRHELVHVHQFVELGPVRFLAKYVGSYLRLRLAGFGHMAAYRRIPLEVEASWKSRLSSVGELETRVGGGDGPRSHRGTRRGGQSRSSRRSAISRPVSSGRS